MNRRDLSEFLITLSLRDLHPPPSLCFVLIIPEQHPAVNRGKELIFNIAPHRADLTTQLIRRVNSSFTANHLFARAHVHKINELINNLWKTEGPDLDTCLAFYV